MNACGAAQGKRTSWSGQQRGGRAQILDSPLTGSFTRLVRRRQNGQDERLRRQRQTGLQPHENFRPGQGAGNLNARIRTHTQTDGQHPATVPVQLQREMEPRTRIGQARRVQVTAGKWPGRKGGIRKSLRIKQGP